MKAVSLKQFWDIYFDEFIDFMIFFPHTLHVRVQLRTRHYLPKAELTARDLAWYDANTNTICILRSALKRGENVVRGIIRHELGHAADKNIEKKGSEARADRLAKQATRKPVRYTADGLQNAVYGKPRRPSYLPKD
jgi:hypothetical protein